MKFRVKSIEHFQNSFQTAFQFYHDRQFDYMGEWVPWIWRGYGRRRLRWRRRNILSHRLAQKQQGNGNHVRVNSHSNRKTSRGYLKQFPISIVQSRQAADADLKTASMRSTFSSSSSSSSYNIFSRIWKHYGAVNGVEVEGSNANRYNKLCIAMKKVRFWLSLL